MYALNHSIFNNPPRCRVIVVPGDSLRGSSFSTGGGGSSTGAALKGVGIAPILASLLGGSSLPTEENDLLPFVTFLLNVLSVHLENHSIVLLLLRYLISKFYHKFVSNFISCIKYEPILGESIKHISHCFYALIIYQMI